MIITTELNWRATYLRVVTLLFTLLGPSGASADDAVSYMPALGNTEQADHALIREVGDEHVFSGDTPILPATSVQAAITLEKITRNDKEASEATGSVIWDSIRQSEGLGLSDSDLTKQYKQSYLEQAYFTNLLLERSRLYIAHLVKALDERFLPVELAILPAIESGFQPTGVSKNNAVGLWQIVPITALEIGITQTRWFDGRADIITSTTAAIDYLSYLNAEFDGDWELTLAAYNAGPGRVRRAMRLNKAAGKGTTYAELDLPAETQNYIPKFAALVQLIKDPKNTELELPLVNTDDAFEVIDLGTRVSLDKLAELSSIPVETLKSLNSGLTFGVTPPDGPHLIYLPREHASEVITVVAAAESSQLFQVPTNHTVVAGETLGGIALSYGMSMRALQTLNRLGSTRIRIGQDLSVVDTRFADQPKLVQYEVASGDTLSDIAARFAVNVSEIVSAAGKPLASDVIRPGDTLQIRVTPANGS